MWKETMRDGVMSQYWSTRSGDGGYDPLVIPPPTSKLPIVDNELVYDENAGDTPRTGSGGGKGRFYGQDTYTEGIWKTLHSLNNLLHGQGGWRKKEYIAEKLDNLGLGWGQGGWRKFFSPAPPDKSVPTTKVQWSNRTRDNPAEIMGRAMSEGILPAWKYVNAHAAVTTPNNGGDYEWCHLLGRGLGGKETSENLVAATHACNSEQLCYEGWLRDKAARRFYFHVKIRAQMSREAPHMAEGIGYTIYLDNNGAQGAEVVTKWFDARRTVEPSIAERQAVWAELDRRCKELKHPYFV
jgi:hypothetical protein